MNIDGVVFHDDKVSGDAFLDTFVNGYYVFKSLRNVIASDGDYSCVKSFLKFADDNVIDAILYDANVNVIDTINISELYRRSSDRYAKECIILTLLRRGHAKWASKEYYEKEITSIFKSWGGR